MGLIFSLIEQNLTFTIENIILLVFMIGSLIFFANDFKLGLTLDFIICAILTIIFYNLQWNWIPSFVSMLIFLVLMCFSLYAVDKTTAQRGLI